MTISSYSSPRGTSCFYSFSSLDTLSLPLPISLRSHGQTGWDIPRLSWCHQISYIPVFSFKKTYFPPPPSFWTILAPAFAFTRRSSLPVVVSFYSSAPLLRIIFQKVKTFLFFSYRLAHSPQLFSFFTPSVHFFHFSSTSWTYMILFSVLTRVFSILKAPNMFP